MLFRVHFLLHCICFSYNQFLFSFLHYILCRMCVCHMFNKIFTYLLTYLASIFHISCLWRIVASKRKAYRNSGNSALRASNNRPIYANTSVRRIEAGSEAQLIAFGGGPIGLNVNKMPFTEEDKHLPKVLRREEASNSGRFLKNFSNIVCIKRRQ